MTRVGKWLWLCCAVDARDVHAQRGAKTDGELGEEASVRGKPGRYARRRGRLPKRPCSACGAGGVVIGSRRLSVYGWGAPGWTYLLRSWLATWATGVWRDGWCVNTCAEHPRVVDAAGSHERRGMHLALGRPADPRRYPTLSPHASSQAPPTTCARLKHRCGPRAAPSAQPAVGATHTFFATVEDVVP